MKKSLAIAILSILLFNPAVLFAAEEKSQLTTTEDPNLLKVYYSEPIGAGDRVYHLTSCSKAPVYAPLRCIKKSKTEAYFNDIDQCKEKGEATENVVKGCAVEGEQLNVGDASYPLADTKLYKIKSTDNAKGCADLPAKHEYVYERQLGIVDKHGNEDDSSKWDLKGTVVWPKGKSTDDYIKNEYLNKIKSDPKPKLEAVPMYRSALCVTYDVLVKDGSEGEGKPVGEITGRVKELFDNIQSLGTDLIEAGCNNDNSAESTIFNEIPYARCSILERISGRTGTELLGAYIGGLYKWAASIVGIVAVLVMVFSGIQISTAGGDSAKLDTAKHRIMQAIIGLVILFLSALILYTINPGFFTG